VISGIRSSVNEISFFCDVTQRRFVANYQRFGTNNQYHLLGSSNSKGIRRKLITSAEHKFKQAENLLPLTLLYILGLFGLEVVPIICPETLPTNYQSTLGNTPEGRRSRIDSLPLESLFLYHK
jgi:hypothetical protein